MSAAEVIEVPEDTVSQHAVMALEEASGDVAQAAKLLEGRVRTNRMLKRALLDPLIQYACHNAVSLESRRFRDKVWNPSRITFGDNAEARIRAIASGNLMMFPLPGGKKLGEASRGEIESASEFYKKQASDMSHKARWLQLVAQSVPADKTARSVLTETRLFELQEEARNG